MGTIAIPGGGPTSNVTAAVDLPVDRLFRFPLTDNNEVVLRRSGEDADGIVSAAVTADNLRTCGTCLTQIRSQQSRYDGHVVPP